MLDDLNITYMLPEIIMAVMAMVLLIVGAFGGDKIGRHIGVATLLVIALVISAVAYTQVPKNEALEVIPWIMNGLLTLDYFAMTMKLLILLAVAMSLVLMIGFMQDERFEKPEIPVLMLLAALGMMIMVSANNLLSLYIGLELQSLALYVLAAIRRDRDRASEAGMKYFVLGALASGILLYGVSMIYGFTGTLSYVDLAKYLSSGEHASIGLIVGVVFLLAGLAFKVSAAPFHMWTPDVYEGSPTAVTAFFSAAPKIAAIAVIIRLLMDPLAQVVDQWQQIVIALAGLSMLVGGFGALLQTNIKRLLAYSSIGHMGFALMGIAGGSPEAVQSVVLYMGLYMFMSLGAFGVVLSMRRGGIAVEQISDLAGLSRTRPALAFGMAVLMFSMAGIPPLAGFFAKLAVFKAAVDAGLFALAVVGAVASVVSAFYYLRIVKVMYFDEAAEAFDADYAPQYDVVTALSVLVMIGFVFAPSKLGDVAAMAQILMTGG